jgi:hypothetical protein
LGFLHENLVENEFFNSLLADGSGVMAANLIQRHSFSVQVNLFRQNGIERAGDDVFHWSETYFIA